MRVSKPKYKQLGLSLIFSALVLAVSMGASKALDPGVMFSRLLIPMGRLVCFICMGLVAGQVIEALGWTRQVGVLARPFFRYSRLGDLCSAAFTTAFLSGAAANAMLLDFYQDGKISKSQLFLSNYMNQFPAFFLHLPTTVFIVLPLTGIAGVLYFVLTFLAMLLRTIGFMVFSRIYHGKHDFSNPTQDTKDSRADTGRFIGFHHLFNRVKKRILPRTINILVWVIPIYSIVFIMHANGTFDTMNLALSRHLSLHFMPVESLSVVILSFAAEFTSGFAAALLDAGVLSVKQTVMALLMGNILAFPIRALRHQLPRYMGIYTPKMGLQLLLSGQFFRIISLILVGLIYYSGA